MSNTNDTPDTTDVAEEQPTILSHLNVADLQHMLRDLISNEMESHIRELNASFGQRVQSAIEENTRQTAIADRRSLSQEQLQQGVHELQENYPGETDSSDEAVDERNDAATELPTQFQGEFQFGAQPTPTNETQTSNNHQRFRALRTTARMSTGPARRFSTMSTDSDGFGDSGLNKPPKPSMPKTLKSTEEYPNWEDRMIIIFEYYGLMETLYKPGNREQITQSQENAGMMLLRQSVSRSIRNVIEDSTATHLLWKGIRDYCMEGSEMTIALLDDEIRVMKIGNTESLQVFLTTLEEKFTELSLRGAPMNTFNKALSLVKAVQSHPQLEAASRYLLVTHSQTNKLTYVATRNTLREEAIRYGFWKVEKQTKTRPQGGNIANVADAKHCKHHPWSVTHTTDECRNKGKVDRPAKVDANVATTQPPQDKVSIVETEFAVNCHTYVVEANQAFRTTLSWIIDSGANQHMCHNLKLMTDTMETPTSEISTAAGQRTLTSNIRGNVKINDHFTLHNVMYVPGLTRNLISLSKIIEHGANVVTTNDGMRVSHDNTYVLDAKLTNGLYYVTTDAIGMTTSDHPNMDLDTTKSHPCGYTTPNKITALWHHRIGHGSHQVLQRMKNHQLATGIDAYNGKDDFCKSCSQGKQTHVPLNKSSSTRSPSAGLMAHTDIIGPMAEFSIDGFQYVLTIVDDYSRLVTCVPITKKSDASDILIQYFSWSERQSMNKIQRLRTDGAGELGIKNYCTTHGIERQITIRGTSEMNGVAERANRTIMEKARSMLYSSPLKRCAWSYAVRYAVHIHNQLSTLGNNRSMSPYEAWSGRVPDLSHLRVFGTRGTSLINDRHKLESKSEDVYFVGFHKERKGYMLLTVDGTEIYRRDVKLDEIGIIKWNLDPKTTRSDPNFLPENYLLTTSHDTFSKPLQDDDQSSKNDEENETTTNDTNLNGRESTKVHDTTLHEERESNSDAETSPNRTLHDRESPGLRRSKRLQDSLTVTPEAFTIFMNDPKNYKQAMQSPEAEQWMESMEKELQSLHENNVWKLVPRQETIKILGSQWVFKKKQNSDGTLSRHKARIVARGDQQTYRVDYEEVFAPVVKSTTLRLIMCIRTKMGWMTTQMDVDTAFLYGLCDKPVHMHLPVGFYEEERAKGLVALLNKSLYGLKQAPRIWYQTLHDFLVKYGFTRTVSDQCCYVKTRGDHTMILLVYVDDLTLVFSHKEDARDLEEKLEQRFSMKMLGKTSYILGIKVDMDETTTTLHQSLYAEDSLTRFGYQEVKTKSTPMESSSALVSKDESDDQKLYNDITDYRSKVGTLMYAMVSTRPDLAYSLSQVSQHLQSPTVVHHAAVKRIYQYLQKTKDHGITYHKGNSTEPLELIAYVDASYATGAKRKSITGYVITCCGGAINWKSKRQSIVAISSTEAEYVALSQVIQEIMWLRALLKEVGFEQKRPTLVMEDNQACIHLAKNPVNHGRSKHIDVKYHFLREALTDGIFKLQYCETQNMVADTLTKALPQVAFDRHAQGMGLHSILKGKELKIIHSHDNPPSHTPLEDDLSENSAYLSSWFEC